MVKRDRKGKSEGNRRFLGPGQPRGEEGKWRTRDAGDEPEGRKKERGKRK